MITIEDIEKKVRQLAEANPEFVYTDQTTGNTKFDAKCGYVGKEFRSTEGAGCIVGQAMQKLGVSEKILLEFEYTVDSVNDAGVEGLLNWLNINGSAKWLSDVQGHQDSSEPWARAVHLADVDGYDG